MKERIFRNFSLKIASVIGALILWTVIVNIYDPTTSVTISNIAVELLNEESLTDNDYSYEVTEGSRISVYISGPKSVITELKSSDIVATADLSKITAFADYVDIDVKVIKDGVELKNVDVTPRTTALKLNVENRLTKEFTVKYSTEGYLDSNYVLGGVSIFPDSVKVTGSSSAIGNIQNAYVTLNVTGRTSDYTENVSVYLVDSEGNVIEDDALVMSRGDADCAVTINQVKTVKVTASGYTGTIGSDYVVKGLELSADEVTIVGQSSVVEAIDEISIPASVVDVSGIVSDKVVSVNLADYVSGAVSFATDSSVTVTAKVVSKDSKDFSVDISKINMINLASDMKATVDSSVSTLTVSVKSELGSLDSFSVSDIEVSANLASLSPGEHIIALTITVPDGYSVDGTYRVKILIERNQPAQQAGGSPAQQATTAGSVN